KKIFFLLIVSTGLSAQPCSIERYRDLIREKDLHVKKGQFDQAMNKLKSARVCQPDSAVVIDKYEREVFRIVNDQRELAIRNKRRADAKAAEAEARAAINSGRTSIDNLNRTYLLASFALQIDGKDPAALGLLLQTYYAHSFGLGDSLVEPPFYRDIFRIDAPQLMQWADAAPGAERLLCANKKTIWVLTTLGEILFQLPIQKLGVSDLLQLRITPDGNNLLAVHRSAGHIVILLWDLKEDKGRTMTLFSDLNADGQHNGVHGLAVNDAGTRAAIASQDTVKVIDLSAWNLVRAGGFTGNGPTVVIEGGASGPLVNIRFLPDKKNNLLVTLIEKVVGWNWQADKKPVDLFKYSSNNSPSLMDACLTQDGRYLIMLEQAGGAYREFNGQYSSFGMLLISENNGRNEVLFRQPESMAGGFRNVCLLDSVILAVGSNTDVISLYRLRKRGEQVSLDLLTQLAGHSEDVTLVVNGSSRQPGLYSFSPDNTVKYWPFQAKPGASRTFEPGRFIDMSSWEMREFSADYTSDVCEYYSMGPHPEIWAQVAGKRYQIPMVIDNSAKTTFARYCLVLKKVDRKLETMCLLLTLKTVIKCPGEPEFTEA
ncbi:MAG: hypothetical protein ABIQ93_11045, partial [Saprospiraceae bacterium]